MSRVGLVVLPFAALLLVGPVAAQTSGLGVGEGVPAFQVHAITGEKAGQQLCYV